LAEQTIDRLQIEINAKANSSVDSVNKLAESIQRLKSSVGGGVDKLSGIAASLNKLDSAVSGLKGKAGTISSIVNSFSKLNDVDTSKITGKIDALKTSVNSLGSMSSEVKTLVNSLGSIANSGGGGISENAVKTAATIAKSQATIDKSTLVSEKAKSGLAEIVAKNNQIAESAKFAAEAEQSLNDAVARATVKTEAKAPMFDGALRAPVKLTGGSNTWELEAQKSLSATIDAVPISSSKAASSVSEIGSAAKNSASSVNEIKKSSDSANESVSKFGGSARNAFRLQNFYGAYFILRRVENVLGGFITNINSYIENMNLFDVAMGTAAQSGEKLANSLQNVLGIDSGEAMKYMGLFQQIDTSFGVTNKDAVTMSENLTQLGYDLASFYNISTATSFEKLESGITGQTKALRQLGIDTSQARLQQELYNLGINKKITDLNQADKAELRYIAIMKQTKNAQGDMARTIQTPANALRVLQAQFTIAGRAIGSIFIPALEMILPVAIAVVKVVGEMASSFASLIGFELPKIDYSSLNNIATEADDAATGVGAIGDNAEKSKKQMDNLIGGFDELNVINKDSDSASTEAGVGTGGGSVLGNIKLPDYNMLLGGVNSQIDGITSKVRTLMNEFKDSAAVKALSNIFSFLWNDAIKPFGTWIIENPNKFADFLLAIGVAMVTYSLVTNLMKIGAAISGEGGVLKGLQSLFPILSNPWALAIAAVAGALVLVGAAIYENWQQNKADDLAKRFGTLELSMEEVESIAKRLTTTKFTVQVDTYIDAKSKLDEIQSSIESAINEIDKMNWKVSIGLKLTPDEIDSYKNEINNFISEAKQYVSQKQYTVQLALNAILTPGSATLTSLTAFTSKYYGNAQMELDKLGTQLSNEVNKAFADGILTEGEAIKISDIQAKMSKLLQKISDAEFSAKLTSLTLDLGAGAITPDSFKTMQSQVQKDLKTQMDKAGGVKVEALTVPELKYKEDGNKAEYDKAVQAIQTDFNKQKATLTLQGLDVSLDALNQKFKVEVDKSKSVFSYSLRDAIKDGAIEGMSNPSEMYEQPMEKWMGDFSVAYNTKIRNLDISSATRSNIKDLVAQLQPTKADLEEIAASSKAAGISVPANVAKGLADLNQLEAITKNQDSINYMIGKKLSTDPDFVNLLATAKGAGEDLNKNVAKGLTDNLQLVKDSASGTIISIKDSVTGKVTEITPTLKGNLSALGIDMSNSFVAGVNGKIPDATTSGENLAKGLFLGANGQIVKDKPNWLELSRNPVNWFNEANEIHSPSKVFESSGENLIQGLWNGVQTMWTKFTGWWENLQIKVPHLVFGWDSLDKYDNFAANAAKKLGMTSIPTVNVKWYAQGGIFNSPQLIGVGERGPEAVVPLSENAAWIQGVSAQISQNIQNNSDASNDENEETKISLLVEQNNLLRALLEKDTTVNLDGEKVSQNTNKHNSNRGYNLGMQPS